MDSMEIVKKLNLTKNDFGSIYRIWNSVYPSQVAFSTEIEFEEYLNKAGEPIHYCALRKNLLVGWLMTFDRGNERWFTLLICKNSQNLGIGKELLKKIKEDEIEINGWILEDEHYQTRSGEYYRPPQEFYLKNGFQVTRDSRESRGIKLTRIHWKLENL